MGEGSHSQSRWVIREHDGSILLPASPADSCSTIRLFFSGMMRTDENRKSRRAAKRALAIGGTSIAPARSPCAGHSHDPIRRLKGECMKMGKPFIVGIGGIATPASSTEQAL